MRLKPEATKGWNGERERPDLEWCYPVYFGLVQNGMVGDEPGYLLRCAACDEPVPWATFKTEEEWQEFRTAVGALKRRYDPDTDEFIYDND